MPFPGDDERSREAGYRGSSVLEAASDADAATLRAARQLQAIEAAQWRLICQKSPRACQRHRREAIRYLRGAPAVFADVRAKPSFFFIVPARNPRTLCCCQPVASIKSSTEAPCGWPKSCKIFACFVTPASLTPSASRFAFRAVTIAFGCLGDACVDSVERCSRVGRFDFGLVELDLNVMIGSKGLERRNGARTAQSPANREAKPTVCGSRATRQPFAIAMRGLDRKSRPILARCPANSCLS